MTLKNKIAVVTGGNKGIGRAIALKLGREGAAVAICARTRDTLQRTSEELKREGVEVYSKVCDQRKREEVDSFIASAKRQFGTFDILVNNAGASGLTPVDEPADEAWRSIIQTNLDGLYYVTSRVVPEMPDGSRIINISSVLGRFGVPGYAAYCTSKHGVIGFTRAAALELAERKITVNALSPGWVETDLARIGMERGAKATGTTYEEFRRRALEAVPLKEMIMPGEVAELVYFLTTPGAANITGQTYNICGGQIMN